MPRQSPRLNCVILPCGTVESLTQFIEKLPKDVIDSWNITRIGSLEEVPQVTSLEEVLKCVGIYLIQQEKMGNVKLPPYNKHIRESLIDGLRKNTHTPLEIQAILYGL